MLQVFAEDEGTYRLERADGTMIGWIRESTIGFRGFDDERRTMLGAVSAWRSLEAALRREYLGWPRYEPAVEHLQLVEDGGQTWIADATRRLARMTRIDDAPLGLPSLTLEFDVPSYVSVRTMLSAAESMNRSLDMAWPAAASAELGDLDRHSSAPAA